MTELEARDEIFALLKSAWDDQAPSIVDAGNLTPEMWWEGQPAQPPDPLSPYAFATLHPAVVRQTSLGGPGNRKFNHSGSLIVQCFGVLGSGKGLEIAEAMAYIVTTAFEGVASPGGIWFRNCRSNVVGPSDGFFQVNAVIDYQYDEVK